MRVGKLGHIFLTFLLVIILVKATSAQTTKLFDHVILNEEIVLFKIGKALSGLVQVKGYRAMMAAKLIISQISKVCLTTL
jgi:hypothetical protein